MSNICSNAYLTIAASLSPADTDGFLGQRDARYMSKLLDDENQVWVREQVPHDDTGTAALNPLFTRAWAFQELLMSQRLVSFGQSEVSGTARKLGGANVTNGGT